MNNYWDAPYRWNGVMQSPGAGGSVAADNMLNVGPQGIPAVTAPAAPQAKPNNGGGAFWKILGTIGDGLAVAGGAKPVYMPAMLDLQQKVDEERKTQAAIAARTQALIDNGATPTQARAMTIGGAPYADVIGKPRAAFSHYDKDNAGNILGFRDDGSHEVLNVDPNEKWIFQDGAMLRIPNVLASRPAPSPDAIAMLKAHPETADQFKSKFGIDPQQYLGGPTQPASGGFRYR